MNIIKKNTFYDIKDFWNNVETCFNSENKEVIFYAHNTQFDFKILNGFTELLNRNWILESHYVKNKTFILVFKKEFSKGKWFTLHIWDTMNYVPKKLEEIGISIGFPKLHIDFNKVSDKELERYCKRDTLIIYKYIKKLIEFLEINDLSRLKATAGSLSFNTFRHKFYNPKKKSKIIYIHHWKRAIKLERESYRGGITDCFNLNEGKNLYKLDINSQYPFTMKEKRLPIKLIAYLHEGKHSTEILKKIYNLAKKRKYGIIAKVSIELKEPYTYILNNFRDINFKKSVFAIYNNDYKITLCQPELEFIEKYGKITKIHEINIYKMKKIFKKFVKFFYSLKVKYKKQNNFINEEFCKLMLNTQYGKWAQRVIEYNEVKINSDFMKEFYEIIKLMILKMRNNIPNFSFNNDICYLGTIINQCELYIVNGKLFSMKQTLNNSKDSFVAISSFITSHSRMLLIKYIKIANRKNVWYCDTDSLFCNEKGYNNLNNKQYINEFDLGKLKIEGKGKGIFYAPKFYDFNNIRKSKGIKKDSVILFENEQKVVYEVNLWQKFKADLKIGYIDKQLITTTTKTSKKLYNKGNIDNLGIIYPYSIKQIKALV